MDRARAVSTISPQRTVTAMRKCLFLSQVSLFSLLLICTLIIPSVTERNGGASNFGDHLSTIVFYVLGFTLCILFLGMAAIKLLAMDHSLRVKAGLLLLIALLDFLVLVSTFPRHLGTAYYEVHDYLGVALYAYEFVLSVWFILRQPYLRRITIFAVQSGGSLIGLLSSLKVIQLLYLGQIIGAIGFGLLLMTAFPAIIKAELRAAGRWS